MNSDRDEKRLVLDAMVAIANADQSLAETEIETIGRVYSDVTGEEIDAAAIADACERRRRAGAPVARELAAAAPSLSPQTKETILRAAYRVLLADERIAAEERKRLFDIAQALRIDEVEMGAILEQLAVEMARET
jgi:uncharacterized tellurite resistance protein B-like protein